MNFLHNEKVFGRIILDVSNSIRIKAAQVEKDYYVFMLLKLIRFYDDQVMFKGGTSLSRG